MPDSSHTVLVVNRTLAPYPQNVNSPLPFTGATQRSREPAPETVRRAKR